MASTQELPVGDGQPGLFDIAAGPDLRGSAIVNCQSCIGACCLEGTVLPLTPGEVNLLVGAGTEMHLTPKEGRPGNRAGWGRKFYTLDSPCGNLDAETGECTNYDERPRVCREVRVGGFVCQTARNLRGLPVDLGMPQLRQ